ncbi:MAG: hypothetical protein PHH08_02480 [Candidatus ainarchaeum sp.]|nr:hypothetical protein [Candidatus ainarchaeum sp.]
MARVRKQQARQMRAGTRHLLAGPWFVPKLVEREMPAPKPGASGQKALERLVASRAKKGVELFNAEIARIGRIPRQERTGRPRTEIPTVKIPVSKATFNEWYSGRRSAEKRAILGEKVKALAEKKIRTAKRLDRKAHRELAFNIGINSILEIGSGQDGEPTHIVIIRRPPAVPEAPKWWDLPAGLVKAGQNPMDIINARISDELGIDRSRLRLIGKGLKPAKKETCLPCTALALQHITAVL